MMYRYNSNSNKESNFFSEAKLGQMVNLGVETESCGILQWFTAGKWKNHDIQERAALQALDVLLVKPINSTLNYLLKWIWLLTLPFQPLKTCFQRSSSFLHCKTLFRNKSKYRKLLNN